MEIPEIWYSQKSPSITWGMLLLARVSVAYRILEYAINDTFNDGKDAVNNLSDKELLSEFKEIE